MWERPDRSKSVGCFSTVGVLVVDKHLTSMTSTFALKLFFILVIAKKLLLNVMESHVFWGRAA